MTIGIHAPLTVPLIVDQTMVISIGIAHFVRAITHRSDEEEHKHT